MSELYRASQETFALTRPEPESPDLVIERVGSVVWFELRYTEDAQREHVVPLLKEQAEMLIDALTGMVRRG